MGERLQGAPPKSSGQLVFDEQEGTWHCRVRADLCTSDTVTICKLPESVVVQLRADLPEALGGDPYSNVDHVAAPANEARRRRTLDDMRRLSEEIKRSRVYKHAAK